LRGSGSKKDGLAWTGFHTLRDHPGILRERLMNCAWAPAGSAIMLPVQWTDTLRFAFQPVINLSTGWVAGLEIPARPETGDILAEARRDPELDGRLSVLALRAEARRETLLPLHVNVFAGALADLGGFTPLHDVVRQAGGRRGR